MVVVFGIGYGIVGMGPGKKTGVTEGCPRKISVAEPRTRIVQR